MKLKNYNHPYYCSGSNFYSNEPYTEFETWSDFLQEWGSSNDDDFDIDMNLVFRWDIGKHNNGNLFLDLFFIHQRKGIFRNVHIKDLPKDKGDELEKWLEPHWKKLKSLWQPITTLSEPYNPSKNVS